MNFRSLIPRQSDKSGALVGRDDFFDPFVTLRREMDRMVDDFFTDFGDRALHAGASRQGLRPMLDMDETDKELIVTAELPGLDEKDFEVTLAGDVLTIKGEKKAEREEKNGDAHWTERRFGSFSRSVQLPFEVKDEDVDAKYDKGVLTIHIPKGAEAQRSVRRIEVKH
jgi:HSP20 family protein